MTASGASRRTVLQAGGALVVAGGSASACGAGASSQGAPASVVTGPVGRPDQVPVGGGVIFPNAAVVVTQPVKGQYHAFSTRCPHQGCQVASVTDGYIVCPCHNSRFAVATGQPTPDSPAQQPLAARRIAVEGGSLVIDG